MDEEAAAKNTGGAADRNGSGRGRGAWCGGMERRRRSGQSGNSPFWCGTPQKINHPPKKNRQKHKNAKKKRKTPIKSTKTPQKGEKNTHKKNSRSRAKNIPCSKNYLVLLIPPDHQQRREFPLWERRRAAPSTVRPLARDLRVLIGWPFPLGLGLDGRLLLARRGRVCV